MTENDKKIAEVLRVNAATPAERKWNCLNEDQIAAYADRRIPEAQRESVESHMANCDYCLGQLAFLARTAQSQLPDEVPAFLISRGLEAAKSKASRQVGLGWRWKAAVSVAAAAACVLVVSVITLREPALRVPAAKPPVSTQAPAGTKSTPVSQPTARTVRGPSKSALMPNLLFPRRGMTISKENIEFRWDSVPGARYYDVTLTNADGDLVWSSQAGKNFVKIPSHVGLSAGSQYFVWVQAHFSQGKTLRSETVAFTISGQP
jgi:Putative zinc-finger